jgi:general secretion pathway protein G
MAIGNLGAGAMTLRPRVGGSAPRAARGFTLIELLVVVAIIGVLAAIAVGQYQRAIQKSKEAVLKENLFVMRTAIHQYFADKGKYPFDLHSLVSDRYLYRVPVDPITGNAESWITEQSEQDEQDISTEPGIADVRSGAQGVGMDGSPYGDW